MISPQSQAVPSAIPMQIYQQNPNQLIQGQVVATNDWVKFFYCLSNLKVSQTFIKLQRSAN